VDTVVKGGGGESAGVNCGGGLVENNTGGAVEHGRVGLGLSLSLPLGHVDGSNRVGVGVDAVGQVHGVGGGVVDNRVNGRLVDNRVDGGLVDDWVDSGLVDDGVNGSLVDNGVDSGLVDNGVDHSGGSGGHDGLSVGDGGGSGLDGVVEDRVDGADDGAGGVEVGGVDEQLGVSLGLGLSSGRSIGSSEQADLKEEKNVLDMENSSSFCPVLRSAR